MKLPYGKYSAIILSLREIMNGATESTVRNRCEKWMLDHEWTSTPNAHSDANYETFQRCLEYLQTASPQEGPDVDRQLLATGIHHPVLLAVHRETMPPFALQSLQHFEKCEREAMLPEGVDVQQCCTGSSSCWSATVAVECCKAVRNKAGDDPPLAFMTGGFDVHLGSRLRSQKSFNVQESWALQSLVSEGAWVVDAGANIGAYTIPLAHRVGRTGRVYAFEPFRLLFQLLTANVAVNGLANVFTHQLALGATASVVQARGPDMNTFNMMSSFQVANQGYSENVRGWTMKHADEVEDIQVVTLDAFASLFKRLDLIKVDVEDMEDAVIIGASHVLSLFHPKVWVENAKLFEQEDQSFLSIMQQRGYTCERPPGMDWELLCVFQA